MPDSMVERVEKAIGDALAEYQAEVRCHRGGWIDWTAISRAVIAELHEPTPRMVDACQQGAARGFIVEMWHRMIDAAMKD